MTTGASYAATSAPISPDRSAPASYWTSKPGHPLHRARHSGLAEKQARPSAPLLKALAVAAKQLQAVDKAARGKKTASLAKTLPKYASAVAQVQLSYSLAKIKDKKVKIGIQTLGKPGKTI